MFGLKEYSKETEMYALLELWVGSAWASLLFAILSLLGVEL